MHFVNKNTIVKSQNKVETIKAPQNKCFYGKMECLTLWPTYVHEKGRTLGKTYGIKARCYWNHPWGTHWEPREHIENLMGTDWELDGNKDN
jgi:hypothetical protein